MLALTASASALNVGTLDSQADSIGHVIEDGAGTGYVTWLRKAAPGVADTIEFCKIPRGGTCAGPLTLTVPLPGAAPETPAGALPVLAASGQIYVVAPRSALNDVLLYTSTNGGASFTGPSVIKPAWTKVTHPTNAFLEGEELLLSGNNPGLGFSAVNTGAEGLGGFARPAANVGSASMGLDGSGNPVQVYYSLTGPPYPIEFTSYKGAKGSSKTSEANWTVPAAVTNGYLPQLAGGAAGLFLLSEDYNSPGEAVPSQVNVRKYAGAGFGAPSTLFEDPSPSLFDGGTIAESPGGRLDVVWPDFSGTSVMRLLVSTDGGASFSAPLTVASLGTSYEAEVNAQVAVNDDGGGWMVFKDSGGLELADLTPEVPPAPPPKEPTVVKTPVLHSSSSSRVGNDVITLAGPKGCLKPGAAITGRLSVKSAKRKHKVVLKIYEVKFILDGKVFKKLIRAKVLNSGKVSPSPYVASVKRTYLAGSTHVLSAQAFIKESHGKHATKTLRVNFLICS
jgi:hypothetical protein